MRAERGQGMKFRLNIEHKIMIPFLTIGILTILCFGTIMTWNGYVQKMERERAAAASSLRALELDAGLSGSGTLLLQKYRLIQNDSLYLFDADGVLLLGTQPPDPDDILLETGLPAFGWRACYALDRTAFWNSLIEEQKYMILATIALLIVIVQVSLFVSYNISEPLRQLSEACRVVAVGEQPVRRSPQVDEYAERSDEIGQLANAFQRMLADIASHTDEILRMKLLNETIVESLPLGIVACSPEKEIICINSKAVEMLDQTGYLCGGQTLRQIVDGIIVSPKVLHDPIRLQNADGRAVDYEIGVWRLRTADEGEGGTLCTLDEITYKKRMEEKLTEGEKLAYTGQLAAMLAHEIRNPLAGIRAGIQVISRRLESDRDRMLSTSILGEVDRVNRLIEDLLHLSRKRESQKVLINLPALFDELLLLYAKIAQNNRIRITARVQGDPPLYADESEIRQVLVNLINNSIKSLHSGGEIALEAHREGDSTVLTVSDTGDGMDEATLRGVHASLEEGRTGGGLGLSIVSRLLAQNNGSFSIDTAAGQGTRITIIFHTGGTS